MQLETNKQLLSKSDKSANKGDPGGDPTLRDMIQCQRKHFSTLNTLLVRPIKFIKPTYIEKRHKDNSDGLSQQPHGSLVG